MRCHINSGKEWKKHNISFIIIYDLKLGLSLAVHNTKIVL